MWVPTMNFRFQVFEIRDGQIPSCGRGAKPSPQVRLCVKRTLLVVVNTRGKNTKTVARDRQHGKRGLKLNDFEFNTYSSTYYTTPVTDDTNDNNEQIGRITFRTTDAYTFRHGLRDYIQLRYTTNCGVAVYGRHETLISYENPSRFGP